MREGRSIDGTAEYLDQIAAVNAADVSVYHPPRGGYLDGKREMISALLARIREECLLWEIDADELWAADKIVGVRQLFLDHPLRTAAIFHCWYFVGPELVIDRRRKCSEIEWRRVWRYRPDMRWY